MKLIIGVADDATSADAMAFGATLARTFPAELVVVTVTATEHDSGAAALVQVNVDRIGSEYGLPATGAVHHHRSLGQGMSEFAAEQGADLVVVGSGPGGSLGRFTMGSTTNQLLHRSTTPLVLVPSGYSRHPLDRLRRIMVAFAQGPEGQVALEAALRLAQEGGLPLDVMTLLVRHRMFGSDLGADAESEVLAESLRVLRGCQDEALARLDSGDTEISADILVGDSLEEAMNREEWEPGDLLVVASASGGILRRVFLGDTTFKILRASRVPTVILPRHHD